MLLAESLLGTSSDAATFIEDVFSTYLYTGNSTSLGTQTITNSIDLSTKGGMVWIKGRSAAANHYVADTVRGAGTSGQSNNGLFTNTQDAENGVSGTDYDFISSFGSTGFTVRQYGGTTAERCTNYNGVTYSSWAFRKQAKFFDIVTYTGTGSARTISHSLGSVPGAIFIKARSEAGDWTVYHRSVGNASYLALNSTAASAATTAFNSTTPTSTVFSIGANNTVNRSGTTYVAYLFAHDAGGFGASGADNVISCGSFTTPASGPVTVTLGYEPQWTLIKRVDSTGDWWLEDTMRGMPVSGNGALLWANYANAEASSTFTRPTATGFTHASIGEASFIYIAIRRGPMKTPTSGTSVFSPVARTGTGATANVTTSGFAGDLVISKDRGSSGFGWGWSDKLRGAPKILSSDSTNNEASYASYTDGVTGFLNTGYTLGADGSFLFNASGYNYGQYYLRRAPGFFDVVCYTGNSQNGQAISHNLSATPQLVIVKCRNVSGRSWNVWSAFTGANYYAQLQTTSAFADATGPYVFGAMSSTVFTVGYAGYGTNTNGENYVAYLFATVAGVSKVGSYTGTGTTKQIDCGFTGGARFVLIKRTDSTGDWYVWDSARGIVAGNDSYLLLNSTAAEVTNTDYVDTYSAGFEISSTAPAAINANGGSFIFFAVA